MSNKRLLISKGLFVLNGVTSIVIGLTHTYAHYTELITSEINQLLDKKIVVTGIESNIWNLWQGMSLMMGILLIIVGLISVSIIWNLKKGDFPPINISIIIILMLLCVVYSGVNYFGEAKVYGGVVGIIVQATSILLTKVKN